MRTRSKILTAAFVKRTTTPGRYGDGGQGSNGLYLRVWTRPSGRTGKTWGQRVRIGGKPTTLGLGPYPVVMLSEAREKALANRRTIHQGRDPRVGRHAAPTFAQVAAKVIALRSKDWKQGSSLAAQWLASLERYAFPVIGHRPVGEITTSDVLAILTPIWSSKPSAAKVVLQRIGAVMLWTVARGYRADNPADVKTVTAALPKNGKGSKHHDALPLSEVPRALQLVRRHGSPVGKLAVEFLALTACRCNEVAGARWSEIDSATATWTVPVSRMKGKRDHRVPLSARALAVLAEAKTLAGRSRLVFPGATGKAIHRQTFGRALGAAGKGGGVDMATPHGFRTNFRGWCAENGVAREVAERALAHVVANSTEAAYNRTDLLERRREAMEQWGRYIAG